MKTIRKLVWVSLLFLSAVSGAVDAPAVEADGVIHQVDYGNNTAVINGVKYEISYSQQEPGTDTPNLPRSEQSRPVVGQKGARQTAAGGRRSRNACTRGRPKTSFGSSFSQ